MGGCPASKNFIVSFFVANTYHRPSQLGTKTRTQPYTHQQCFCPPGNQQQAEVALPLAVHQLKSFGMLLQPSKPPMPGPCLRSVESITGSVSAIKKKNLSNVQPRLRITALAHLRI